MALSALCTHAHASSLKYQPVVSISTGTVTPNYFTIGDFNGDGKPDLAVPDSKGQTISVYLSQKDGSFGAPVVTTLSIADTLGAILSGDFNGDGKADLVVSTVAGNQVAIVLLGNGDGTFAVQPPIAGSFGFLSGKVADFNGDGHPDLFLGGNGSPYLFLGQGNGTFSPGSVGHGSFPGLYSGVCAADFNGDKHLDAIAADFGDPGSELGTIDFFAGDGSGSLANAVPYQPAVMSNPGSVDVADFNGDGKADLLAGGNGAAFIFFGNGDGTFQMEASQSIAVYVEPSLPNFPNADDVNAIVADLNQDGKPDAVVLDGTSGLLSLVLNDGTGTFPNALSTPYTFPLAAGSYSVATADFNGDGLPDIVVSSSTAKTIFLLLSVKSLSTPTLSLKGSGNNLLVGTGLMFTATVTGGTTPPTGTVSLLDGSSQIAQETLDTSGTAVFSLSDLSAGVHTLSSSYSGDSNYAPATSAAVSQSVTDFQVTLTTASQTVTAGSTADYTLTVTPEAGFTGTVTLTCSGLPSLATCASSPVNVGTTASTATVAINTTAATTALTRKPEAVTYAWVLLSCFSLCGVRKRSRTSRRRLSLLLPILLFSLTCGPMACSGGGSKPSVPGTPSGTSSITISATATQNGVTATHTATATLIVQ